MMSRSVQAARAVAVVVAALVALLVAATGSRAAPPLPDSLATHYPPQAAQPVFLYGMMDLGHAWSGILLDLQSGELKYAKENYRVFRAQYLALATMVPEWAPKFPTQVLDQLGQQLESGNINASLDTLMQSRAVCGSCHADFMIPVQLRFFGGDFSAVAVTDPVSDRSGSYSLLKWSLQDSFSGLLNDARHGKQAKAEQRFEEFEMRFEALAQSCSACHEAERQHYVGPESRTSIKRLEQHVRQAPLDAAAVAAAVREVNEQICRQCHLVHMPGAFARGSH